MLGESFEKLIPIIKEMCERDKTGGHDIVHFNRTMKIALYLQSKEGGEPLSVGISSFLHDVPRLMQSETRKYVTPNDSLDKVLNIIKLSKINIMW